MPEMFVTPALLLGWAIVLLLNVCGAVFLAMRIEWLILFLVVIALVGLAITVLRR